MESLSVSYDLEKKTVFQYLLSELANCSFMEIAFLFAGGKVLLKWLGKSPFWIKI